MSDRGKPMRKSSQPGRRRQRPSSLTRAKIALPSPGLMRGTILIVGDDEDIANQVGFALRARGFFPGTTSTAAAAQWADLPFEAGLVLDGEHEDASDAVAELRDGGFGGALLVGARTRGRAIPGTKAIRFPTLYANLEVAILQALPGRHLSIWPMGNPYGICLDDRFLDRVLSGVDLTITRRLLRAMFDTVLYEELAETMGMILYEDPQKRMRQVNTMHQAVSRVRKKLWPLGVGIETEAKRGYRIHLVG